MAETVKVVTSMLKTHFHAHGRIPFVCDPVCVSTSGHVLLQSDAVKVAIKELFPLPHVITPNQAGAELLLKESGLPCYVASLGDMLAAAQNLLKLGSDAVLLKGGHICVLDDVRSVRVPEVPRWTSDLHSSWERMQKFFAKIARRKGLLNSS